MLRANAANPAEGLSQRISSNWNAFSTNLAKSNGYELATLRDAGVDVLANITAGDTLDANDWAGRWELWQHYYAVAYVMSHKYGVRRYSMYNEPNHGNKIKEEQWLDLLLVCSDAIQSAIQDVNSALQTHAQTRDLRSEHRRRSIKIQRQIPGKMGKTPRWPTGIGGSMAASIRIG